MKNILYFAFLLIFVSFASAAYAETSTTIRAEAQSSDGSSAEVKVESTIEASSSQTVEVGGESEDIGAPSQGSSVPGVEPDEIDASATGSDSSFSVEREMKESGEKGGTSDINIGVGELGGDNEHKDWIIIESAIGEPTRMNKADLIDSISNSSDGGLRAAFMKLGDIKGEADDSAQAGGGNGDIIIVGSATDEDETAAKTSKPKEIVVVGSKVRSEGVPQLVRTGDGETRSVDSFFDIWVEVADPAQATTPDSFFDIFIDLGEERTTPDSFFDIFVDVSLEDLQLQAVSVAQSDDTVKEVDVQEDEVRVVYDEQMRLFGVIPIQGTRTVVVETTDPDRADRVKVRFPWWHFLATKTTNVNDLTQAIETELDGTLPVVPHPIRAQDEAGADERPTEEVAFYYNKIQAQTLQTISNVSKALNN